LAPAATSRFIAAGLTASYFDCIQVFAMSDEVRTAAL
jgi:hypothetical protein